MFDFHEKRKIKSVLYSKGMIVVLFFVAAALSFSVYDRYTVAKEMRGKLEAKRSELEALTVRTRSLEEKVVHMKDARGVEEELRNRFDVAKEGERVVVLIDRENDIPREGEAQKVQEAPVAEDGRGFFDFLKFWR